MINIDYVPKEKYETDVSEKKQIVSQLQRELVIIENEKEFYNRLTEEKFSTGQNMDKDLITDLE